MDDDVPVLLGDRVRLRPWRADDQDAIFRACQDPAIQRFTTVPSPYCREDAAWFLAHYRALLRADGGATWCVEVPDEPGRVAGNVGLLHVRDGSAELGYWTAPGARGRGLGTAAVALLVEHVLARDDVDEVELVVESTNAASLAVGRRAGFVEDRHEPARAMRDGSVRDCRGLVRRG